MFSRFVKYLSTSLNNQATFSTDTISFLYDLWHLLDIREDYSQPRPCLTGSYSLLFWTEHTFSPCRRFILFFFTKITFLILSITVFSFITFLASLEPMSRSSSQWKPHSIIIILNQGMGKNLPLKKVQFDYHYQFKRCISRSVLICFKMFSLNSQTNTCFVLFLSRNDNIV